MGRQVFFCLHGRSSSLALYLVTIHTFDYGRHLRDASVSDFKTTGISECMRRYWPFLRDVMVMTVFDRRQDGVNRAVCVRSPQKKLCVCWESAGGCSLDHHSVVSLYHSSPGTQWTMKKISKCSARYTVAFTHTVFTGKLPGKCL